jgi:hypothetical protein
MMPMIVFFIVWGEDLVKKNVCYFFSKQVK